MDNLVSETNLRLQEVIDNLATIKKEYEKNKESYDTVTASHILISTQDDSGNELSDKEKERINNFII